MLLQMPNLESLQKEIEIIKQRNQRVEADKDWETSWMRRIIITVLTYLVIVVFFYAAKLPEPFLNSIVPAVAFILSSSSLLLFRKIWQKHKKNNLG